MFIDIVIGKRGSSIEDEEDTKPHSYPKIFAIFLATIAIAISGAFGGAQLLNYFQSQSNQDSLAILGIQPLSVEKLEEIVTTKKIVAYWVGPEQGFSYLLDASISGRISVKYVPTEPSKSSTGPRQSFREVVTFEQKEAFSIVLNQTKNPTCQSFVNGDGNAVRIDSSAPKIIYIGIKGKPIQVLLYDPDTTRNLSFACQKSGVVQIGQH